VNITYAQDNGSSHSISTQCELLELGEDLGQIVNVSSINLLLPSAAWNITDVELNFTDIKLEREENVIEDQDLYGENFIYYSNPTKKRLQLGVQLKILETTTIYGLYIYGRKVPGTVTDIKFQINGYDNANNKPNNTIYRKIDLNISDAEDWYYQDFSSAPKTLTKGNYSLVMNGTEIGDALDKASLYYWKYNEINPITPNLYISEYVNSWTNSIVNSTYLHKIIQKTDKIYWPEDIEMKVGINGQDYNVSNGLSVGNGNSNITDLNFSSGFDFEIPIKTNQDIRLIFNLSYIVNAKKSLISNSIVKISENLPNNWSLYFDTHRYFNKHIIKFYYPKSWENLSISRDIGLGWENISLDISIDEINNILTIHNENITDGADWEIIANSPNIDLNLYFPGFEWEPEQVLQFSIPIVEGNFTFFITNPLGFRFEESIEISDITLERTFFSYTIPEKPLEGTYLLEIFWNNGTDAGVQSQEFQVKIPPVPFTVDPMLIVIGIVSAIGVSVLSVASYITIRNYRRRKIEEAQKFYNKCMDVLNLDYIIVSDKKSGLNVYQQKFTTKEIDAAMISGFLQAIHTFGIELIKIEDQSQTIKLEYKDSIIIMTEFVNLRLILIMKEHPSPNFLYSLDDLAYDIYKFYGALIEEFTGDIKPFKTIEKLLKRHLNTSLTYPMTISKKEKLERIRISQSEKSLINKATFIMKKSGTASFVFASLLPEGECSPKDIEIFLKLIDKNIFQVKDLNI
jgi:hypothetical protein